MNSFSFCCVNRIVFASIVSLVPVMAYGKEREGGRETSSHHDVDASRPVPTADAPEEISALTNDDVEFFLDHAGIRSGDKYVLVRKLVKFSDFWNVSYVVKFGDKHPLRDKEMSDSKIFVFATPTKANKDDRAHKDLRGAANRKVWKIWADGARLTLDKDKSDRPSRAVFALNSSDGNLSKISVKLTDEKGVTKVNLTHEPKEISRSISETAALLIKLDKTATLTV